MRLLMTVLHRQWSKPNPLVPRVFPPVLRDGVIVTIDWDTERIVSEVPFDSPAGHCFSRHALFLASMVGNRVVGLRDTARSALVLTHGLFNDLHTIRASKRGFLVTCSGTDAIVEVDLAGRTVWSWLATEHGLDRTSNGQRRVVRRWEDYTEAPPQTAQQTTHINSAEEVGESIVATLFAQGAVVEIERSSGRWRRVVNGLMRPHSIRARPGGWVICDSGANGVVLLERDYSVAAIIEHGFDWPQDAMVVDADGNRLLVLDANNMRIVEIRLSTNRVVKEMRFPERWKGFALGVYPEEWPTLDALPGAVQAGEGRGYDGTAERNR